MRNRALTETSVFPLLFLLTLFSPSLRAGAPAECAPAGDGVAAVLGVTAGCVAHVLADVFYVVPVQLLWPHPRQFTFPLLLPPREAFTNRTFKLAMLADFFSDNLYILPLLFVCAKYRCHEATWRRFAAFWAFQAAVVLAHLHPALMDNRYSHEDFIYWLHLPCGMAFILVLNVSPLLLRDGVRVLSFPKEAAAEREERLRDEAAAAKAAAEEEADAKRAARPAASGHESAVVPFPMCTGANGGAEVSPASSGASAGADAPRAVSDTTGAVSDAYAADANAALASPPLSPTHGGLRKRALHRVAASASALLGRGGGGGDACGGGGGSDSECSSPARRVRSDARMAPAA
jgi:hypothetical protein